MIVICIGPVCIPGHMILAALLGFLHQYGWFKWIKQEWVTYRYWRDRYRQWRGIPVTSNNQKKAEVELTAKQIDQPAKQDSITSSSKSKEQSNSQSEPQTGLRQRPASTGKE